METLETRLDELKEDQALGHTRKVIKEAWLLLKDKSNNSWRLHKQYCQALNKLTAYLLSSQKDCLPALRRVIRALDRAILEWTNHMYLYPPNCHTKELYLQQLLQSIIHKAWAYVRTQKAFEEITMLECGRMLYESAKRSENPDTQHICGVYQLTRGMMRWELGAKDGVKMPELIPFTECLKHTYREQRVYLQHRGFFTPLKGKLRWKVSRSLLLSTITLYCIGMYYQLMGNFREALFAYRICRWHSECQSSIFQISNDMTIFIEKSLIEEIQLLESMDSANYSKQRESEKKKAQLEPEEIFGHIDQVWKRNFKNVEGVVENPVEKKKQTFKFVLKHVRNPHLLFPSQRGSAPVSSRKKNKVERELKKYDIDENIKGIICDKLIISKEWLEERARKNRKRGSKIEAIQESERSQQRAYKILQEYLQNKKGERLSKIEKGVAPKEVKKQVHGEITMKLRQFSPRIETGDLKAPTAIRCSSRSCNTSPTSINFILPSTAASRRRISQDMKVDTENMQKSILFVAKNLSREIKQLQQSSQPSSPNNSALHSCWKSKEAEKFSHLSASIIMRNRRLTIQNSFLGRRRVSLLSGRTTFI